LGQIHHIVSHGHSSEIGEVQRRCDGHQQPVLGGLRGQCRSSAQALYPVPHRPGRSPPGRPRRRRGCAHPPLRIPSESPALNDVRALAEIPSGA
jgi:hypothetical protein